MALVQLDSFDVCLWGTVAVLMAPAGLTALMLFLQWRSARRRPQTCPQCGVPARVMGRDTRCDRCGCLYDKHGRMMAPGSIGVDWARLDLGRFRDRPDQAARGEPGYQGGKDNVHG